MLNYVQTISTVLAVLERERKENKTHLVFSIIEGDKRPNRKIGEEKLNILPHVPLYTS